MQQTPDATQNLYAQPGAMPPQYGQPATSQAPVYGQPPQNGYPNMETTTPVYVAAPVGAQVMAPGQAPMYAPAPGQPGLKQDDQCCGCIEIRTGMKILFVLAVLQVFWYCFLCLNAFGKFPANLLVWFFVQVFCQASAAYCFYLGVKEDTI